MFIFAKNPSIAALVAVAALSMTAAMADAQHRGGQAARPSAAYRPHESSAAHGYGHLPKNGPSRPSLAGKNSARGLGGLGGASGSAQARQGSHGGNHGRRDD